MACTLDRYRQAALVLCTEPSATSRGDLTSLCDIVLQQINFFVVNSQRFVRAERALPTRAWPVEPWPLFSFCIITILLSRHTTLCTRGALLSFRICSQMDLLKEYLSFCRFVFAYNQVPDHIFRQTQRPVQAAHSRCRQL